MFNSKLLKHQFTTTNIINIGTLLHYFKIFVLVYIKLIIKTLMYNKQYLNYNKYYHVFIYLIKFITVCSVFYICQGNFFLELCENCLGKIICYRLKNIYIKCSFINPKLTLIYNTPNLMIQIHSCIYTYFVYIHNYCPL